MAAPLPGKTENATRFVIDGTGSVGNAPPRLRIQRSKTVRTIDSPSGDLL